VSYHLAMVKTTLYLEEETLHVLEQLASREGRSQGEVLREALLVYKGTVNRPAPKGVGMYRSGRSDISEKAEELLFQDGREDR
jgi:Ribbon-helix-helix protein, copG family